MRSFGDDATVPHFDIHFLRPSLSRYAWIILLFCLSGTGWLRAQQTKGEMQSTSIFVYPTRDGAASDELRARVIEKLQQVKSIHMAPERSSAGAALRIKAVIWPTGTVTLNPKSHSGSFTNYEGYASAYLYSLDGVGSGTSEETGRVLWTYLATPKRFHLAGIIDDLSGQIADALARTAATGLSGTGPSTQTAGVGLKVAGATFPAPLYLKWFQSFEQLKGGVPISYDAVGSVRGTEELASGVVDMAASDIPPASANGAAGNTLHIPGLVGAIVPIYNLPGRSHEELELSGRLLADIYAGRIARWDDPAIAAANHGIHLPHAAISVIHRNDGSGTTFVWTSYLAQAGGAWKAGVGAAIDWPIGVGVEGNEGVAEEVAKTANSIGYVELAYAIQHRLNYAAVRNPAGRSIKANLETVSAAAEAAAGGPSSSLINNPAKDAYPITTFTWLIVPQSIADPGRRASVIAFLHWMLTSGQRQCAALGYAPLPRKTVSTALRQIDALK